MLGEGYVYLDVRTPVEYAEGHPPGAYNVPFAYSAADGLAPNPAFVDEVRALVPPTRPVVVGCATGVRSLAAARLLIEAGFQQVVEQRAGMSGVRDAFGRVQERGWRDEGLPVEGADEATYEEKS